MLLIEKVFGNGLNKVGCWHEDPERAEDCEEGESHETEPVDDRCCKLPLVAHGLVFILVSEAFGNKAHLIQDLGQLRLHAAHWGAVSGGQEHLIFACSSNHLAAENPRVGKHVAVVRLGGTGFELNAGQAASWGLVETGWAHSRLTWALHAKEPGAPVQQDDAGLWEPQINYYLFDNNFEKKGIFWAK